MPYAFGDSSHLITFEVELRMNLCISCVRIGSGFKIETDALVGAPSPTHLKRVGAGMPDLPDRPLETWDPYWAWLVHCQ